MAWCNTGMDLALDQLSVDGVSYTRNDNLLGKGGFGVVFSGYGSDGSNVAIKYQFICERNPKDRLLEEYRIHRDLTKSDTHGHVVRFIGMDETPKSISFVLELAPQSLFDKLKARSVTPEDAQNYFHSLINGIQFMHSKMYVHCDVKPENLLICDGTLKIADFGKAKKMGNKNQKYKNGECIGTKEYAAPELWKEQNVQGQPLDIWCAGIVLLQLTQSPLEFRAVADNSDKKYARWVELAKGGKQTRADFCYKFKPATTALLKRMLSEEPGHRISIEGIKQDPCFTGETAVRKRKATGNTVKAAKKGKN
ncbi:hypothetical protein CAEBREN_01429 [Caenorhabditis brenneri]|uniref:Protein kinase domain-containing protein n=1 Tax=Caenorhabditis brenneri TaxID=135651 RepID=G0NJY4_CAEBE|nr:hypothetical protein CAEBREN_01429 [Caenorhabditis brenneri]